MSENLISPLIFSMEERYQDYLIDESKLIGNAESISFPKNETEVIEIIKLIGANNINITIQGGKTGIVGGCVPQCGHIMNLSNMNKVIRTFEKDEDMFIVVEPGVTLMALQQEINRQFKNEKLMWRPSPTETTATVGGVAATNAKGINSVLYGDSKQYIVSARLAMSNGEVVSIDGEKLDEVLGTEGVLGVFTELTLKLSKRPSEIWGITLFFEQDEDLYSFVDELNNIQKESENIVAMEYLDRAIIDKIEAKKSTINKIKEIPDIESKYVGMVYVEIQGEEEEIEELANVLMEKSMECGCDPDTIWAVSGEGEVEKMRDFRHAAAEVVNLSIEEKRQAEPRITKISSDFSYPNNSFGEMVKYFKNDLVTTNLNGCVFGHIKDNHLHTNIIPSNFDEYQKGLALLNKWGKFASENGGEIVFEHGIGKIKKDVVKDLLDKSEVDTLINLKNEYDSKQMWNVGTIL